MPQDLKILQVNFLQLMMQLKSNLKAVQLVSMYNIPHSFVSTLLCHCAGLVTLNEMKAKQEDLVREREKQLAANLIETEK